jgi:hypothetical protein
MNFLTGAILKITDVYHSFASTRLPETTLQPPFLTWFCGFLQVEKHVQDAVSKVHTRQCPDLGIFHARQLLQE